MLAIRMQRTGRKGHAMFRVIVQDSHRTPTSGNVVAALGNYDPHTKAAVLDKEKTSFYLEHGAQPSERMALLLRREGIKLPNWVIIRDNKKAKPRHEKKQPEAKPKEAPKAEAASETELNVEPNQETAVSEESVKEETTPEAPVDSPTEDTPAADTTETEATAAPAEETAVENAEPAVPESPAEATPSEEAPEKSAPADKA